MSQDDLLSRLGQLAREREAEDPELRALVEGRLSLEERRALEARSSRDPEQAAAVRLHAPLPEEVRSQLLARALAATQPATPRPATARPVRRNVRWLVPAGVVAAAAAALLVFLWPAQRGDLPPYRLSTEGGLADVRSTNATPTLRMMQSSRVVLLMRPARDVREPVEFRLLARRDGGLEHVPAHVEASPNGALRATLEAREIFGASATTLRLVALVCHPEICEQAQRAIEHGPHDAANGWEAQELTVVYEP